MGSLCSNVATDTEEENKKKHVTTKIFRKMFGNCISRKNCWERKEGEDNRPLLECKEELCTTCLVEELRQLKWHSNPYENEDQFLKTAFEKNIIEALPKSIKTLTKDDKKRVSAVLTLCHLEQYNLC